MNSTENVEKGTLPTEFLTQRGYVPSKTHSRKVIMALILRILIFGVVLMCAALISVVVIKFRPKPSKECSEAVCPHNWIGFQEKCFYFSDDANNWTFSQSFCDSQDADLVQVESQEELSFLMRYKGPSDHWIGLRRKEGEPWKWINGIELEEGFPVRGRGECAYLNDKGASSARHYTERKWICSKPNAYVQMRMESSI